MSASSQGIGELGYGTLYLPSVSFLYLSSFSGKSMDSQLSLLGANLDLTLSVSQTPLLVLFLLSFIGAMEVHGVTRRIFGQDGPEERPKRTSVAQKHAVALILDVHPDKIDEKPIIEWVSELSVFDFVVVIIRALVFVPAAFLKPYVMISAGLLVVSVLSGVSGPIGLFLLAGHGVLYFQDTVWKLLPPLHTDSPSQNVYMPEYRNRGERSSERRVNSARNQPPKPSFSTNRGQTSERDGPN